MRLNRAYAHTENFKLQLAKEKIHIFHPRDSHLASAFLEIIAPGDTCAFLDIDSHHQWTFERYTISELWDISRLVLLLPHIKESGISVMEFRLDYAYIGFVRRLDDVIERKVY